MDKHFRPKGPKIGGFHPGKGGSSEKTEATGGMHEKHMVHPSGHMDADGNTEASMHGKTIYGGIQHSRHERDGDKHTVHHHAPSYGMEHHSEPDGDEY